MPSESDFLDWLRTQQKRSALVDLPAGDDLAILNWPASQLLLVGVDQVMEGVHFDLAKHSPRQVGIKAMNRNLSDCAAMACLPAAALVSVALPKERESDFARELYLGVKEAGEKFDCHIVGGDTGTWRGPLVVTVSILGKAPPHQPLLRSGARPGDSLYVTGPLGGSLLGRHTNFTPRITEAIAIAQTQKATAMIDLSDGLSRDLPRICHASHVGAILDDAKIPIHPDAITMSQSDSRSALEHALHDGEDYELLFTGRDLDHLGTRVGEITSDPAILISQGSSRIPLQPLGWEHQW